MTDTQQVIERESRQPRFQSSSSADGLGDISFLVDWVYRSHLVEPDFSTDTREYDDWLIDFANNEPHLAGILSSVVSKDKNRAWTLTGGQRRVRAYGDRLKLVEGGDGWRHFISLQSRSYYNTNMGAITEIETSTGRVGDEMVSLYHVDPTRVRLLNKYKTPLRYYPRTGRVQDWYRGEYFRTVSNPDVREKWLNVGMCAVNRCLSLAKMLVAVYEHDLEQLGASPPRGFLVGDNITLGQYQAAIEKRKIAKENGELEFDVLALFSTSSGISTNLRFIPYSSLPVNFDLDQFTYLIMLGYALAFGYDAQEFYPVKGGSFGQDKQAEIQASKTTYKGEADFSLEYQNHIQGTLPEGVIFEFDRNNTAGDLLVIQRDAALIENANKLYAPSNRQPGQSGLASFEEGREYLVDKGVIDPEWLNNDIDFASEQDTEDMEDVDTDEDTGQTDDNEAGDTDPDNEVNRLRRIYRHRDDLVRESEMYPDQPIIQLSHNPETGITESRTIWTRGGDLRDSHRNWQGVTLKKRSHIKRSSRPNPLSDTYETDRGVFYDPFLALIVNHKNRCDCQRCQTTYTPRNIERFAGYTGVNRAEDGEELYSDGDVLITTGDVDLAIEEAYAVNSDLGDLMVAESVVRIANIKSRAFTWDANAQRYRYDNGQFVSAATIRELTQESIESHVDRVSYLAQQVDDGSLNASDFGLVAREEIKREYIRQIVVGRGGRASMTPADWGRVGQQLKVQYQYLDGFIADIENHNLTEGQIRARLNMYFESSRQAYYAGRMASFGVAYNKLPAYPGDGTTDCLTNCKCFWRYNPYYVDGVLVGYKCTWVRTVSESCDTCIQREVDWVDIIVMID